jgi:hypothetical protein
METCTAVDFYLSNTVMSFSYDVIHQTMNPQENFHRIKLIGLFEKLVNCYDDSLTCNGITQSDTEKHNIVLTFISG